MNKFKFKILYQDKKTQARVGEITTPHGKIYTPAFVPVGTQATVKSLTPEELKELGVNLFFVNTYHAYLRPGIEVISKHGGLHQFMNWDKPLITDSGGFQVFSLGSKKYINIAISESAVLDRKKFTQKLTKQKALQEQVYPDDYRPVGKLVKIDQDGVTFTSHWDGSKHRFTPEKSIQIQHQLGADMMITFDECAPYPATHKYAQRAMHRTHKWAVRCLKEHQFKKLRSKSNQALYGVVQGGIFQDLREQSADFISEQNFDGIAIGGVSVGESKKEMRQVCDWVIPRLPKDKPRHLLGVGELDDIFDIIERGVDTFDCVQPTRLARMGHIMTKPKTKNKKQNTSTALKKFSYDITKKKYASDMNPLGQNCQCFACQNFTKAYIHHLFRVRELLAYRLATIHNLHFVLSLVQVIRKSIANQTVRKLKQAYLGY